MCKYVSFQYYNKLNKYILYYLLFKSLYEYLFNPYTISDKIAINLLKKDIFVNNNILVQGTFNHLCIFIISLIIFKSKMKSQTIKKDKINNPSNALTLIHKTRVQIKSSLSLQFFCSIISLFIICTQIKNIFSLLELMDINFWMVEILFICLVNSAIFKTEIYNHKKLAIGIIIIFSTIFKILSAIESFKDNTKNYFLKRYRWLIPVGIVLIILNLFGRDYAMCQMKYLFDLKYISEIKFLMWLGFFGIIINLIGSLISTFIPCINKNNINYICKIKENNNLYFDNYKAYFEHFWKKDKKTIENLLRILIILTKPFIFFFCNLYQMIIIKFLSPEYFICSYNIFYFIIELANIIGNYIFGKSFEKSKIYNLLAEFFAIIGTFIYLEFIQLKCCGLDYYLKKNIYKRGEKESNIEQLYLNDDQDLSISNTI